LNWKTFNDGQKRMAEAQEEYRTLTQEIHCINALNKEAEALILNPLIADELIDILRSILFLVKRSVD
jgi:hypothetical protein